MSAARLSRCLTATVGIQKPDRSGCPSVVRRAGALRSILPSGVRGWFFQGYGSHWAAAVEVSSQASAKDVSIKRMARILSYVDRGSVRLPPSREPLRRPPVALAEAGQPAHSG